MAWLFPAIIILATPAAAQSPERENQPNIVFILADDLGYAELGCYGQKKIRTPHLDALAAAGMRFTQFYAGSPVCAPSRCTLLTGKHTGHTYIRGNYELGNWEQDSPEGQLPLPPDTVTLASLLKRAGYATAAIGKWGLGGPDSTGHPNRQGFDFWYGYLCQRVAHNYYPTHLWRNTQKDMLPGNSWFRAHQKLAEPPRDPAGYERFRGQTYAPDRMIEEALQFVRDHKQTPFFLYFATPVPHAAIQVPDDSLREYHGRFDKRPYLGEKGYLPHPEPRAGYAAMVTRMDRDVGRLLRLLDELGIADNTLVLFSSDNGPTFNGGTDSAFFESAGPLRGLKASLYEGGIRVPLIVRWPGHVAAGTTSDHVGAFWDVLPTIADVAGFEVPADCDGISILPTLLGRTEAQRRHAFLYWEYAGGQAVRMGDWKAVWPKRSKAFSLYDLAHDIGETTDVAAEHPKIVEKLHTVFLSARTPSEHFPLSRE